MNREKKKKARAYTIVKCPIYSTELISKSRNDREYLVCNDCGYVDPLEVIIR